jgi:hypothetical protein
MNRHARSHQENQEIADDKDKNGRNRNRGSADRWDSQLCQPIVGWVVVAASLIGLLSYNWINP